MMKKIFAFILSAAMMISVVSTTAMAAEDVTFTAGNVTVNKDTATTVSIDIDLSNNPGLTAVNFKVGYDAEAFEYKAAKKSEYKIGYEDYDITLTKPNKALNPFIISAYSADAWYEDDTFVTLVFYLKDGVKNGTYPITLTAGDMSTTDENGSVISTVNYVSGSITVEGKEDEPTLVENPYVFSFTADEETEVKITNSRTGDRTYSLPSFVKGTATVNALLKITEGADVENGDKFTIEAIKGDVATTIKTIEVK